MFGYITICRENLSDAGYDCFRAYYCGLCREMGKRGSQLARLGLSYDITFLAIVLSSLFSDGTATARHCPVKLGRSHPCVENDASVSYAADMGILLSYLKLKDDRDDEKSIKALFKMLLFRRAVKNAKKRHPAVYDNINERLSALSALEKRHCKSIDETADCFAGILEILFTPDFITDNGQKRALAWLGYNIGRWIYIMDAYSDIEKDKRKNSYNTFICASPDKTAEEIKAQAAKSLVVSLTFTLENASSAYNLLDIKRNREVIENILFDALKLKQKMILGATDESL